MYEGMVLLALVMITGACLFPSVVPDRSVPADAACLVTMAAVASGTVPADTVCPVSGKPYRLGAAGLECEGAHLAPPGAPAPFEAPRPGAPRELATGELATGTTVSAHADTVVLESVRWWPFRFVLGPLLLAVVVLVTGFAIVENRYGWRPGGAPGKRLLVEIPLGIVCVLVNPLAWIGVGLVGLEQRVTVERGRARIVVERRAFGRTLRRDALEGCRSVAVVGARVIVVHDAAGGEPVNAGGFAATGLVSVREAEAGLAPFLERTLRGE